MFPNSFRLPLRILAWEAWAGPALADKQAWRAWARTEAEWESGSAPAPVAAMAPLLRRRADAADRLALEVAFRLAPPEGIPSVFASRHGQVARSTAMLRAQATGEPVSPADFSFSVHNATAGQYSIAAGDRSASSSLSSREESFTAALLEAQGMILEGRSRVLAVMSDRMPPEAFDGLWDREPAGYALGLVLGASGGEGFDLSLGEAPPGTDTAAPQALVFLKALAGDRDGIHWQRGARRWTWSRS